MSRYTLNIADEFDDDFLKYIKKYKKSNIKIEEADSNTDKIAQAIKTQLEASLKGELDDVDNIDELIEEILEENIDDILSELDEDDDEFGVDFDEDDFFILNLDEEGFEVMNFTAKVEESEIPEFKNIIVEFENGRKFIADASNMQFVGDVVLEDSVFIALSQLIVSDFEENSVREAVYTTIVNELFFDVFEEIDDDFDESPFHPIRMN